MNYLIPLVGLRGQFKFNKPFDTILNDSAVYKTTAVRTITEMETEDIDVLKVIYLDQNLTADDYEKDLKSDMPIAVLQAEGGGLYYIPVKYFSSLPNITGVIYAGKAMFINLGNVPVNLNLDFIIDDLKDIIKSVSGLNTTIEIEEVTGRFIVPYKEHDKLEKERESNMTNNETCYSRLFKITELYKSAKSKITILLRKLEKFEKDDKD